MLHICLVSKRQRVGGWGEGGCSRFGTACIGDTLPPILGNLMLDQLIARHHQLGVLHELPALGSSARHGTSVWGGLEC